MANILEIKPLIRNFIVENIDASFRDNVYWLGERLDVPDTQFCLLTVISESKDKRTSSHNGYRENSYSRNKIWTVYKTATITVGIYINAMDGSYRNKKEFAYSQINKLEQLFEIKDVNNIYSINRISPIRPLHEVVDGGYQYRFEFDITIGYNETITMEKLIGNAAQVEIFGEKCGEDMIGFVVELEDEDKIVESEINNDKCNCNL